MPQNTKIDDFGLWSDRLIHGWLIKGQLIKRRIIKDLLQYHFVKTCGMLDYAGDLIVATGAYIYRCICTKFLVYLKIWFYLMSLGFK